MTKRNDKNEAKRKDIAALLKKANELYPPTQPNGYQFESAKPVKDDRLRAARKKISSKTKTARTLVQGPPSIVELSRALNVDNNGPQLMFEWVYSNIEWEPGWGVYKGALGCLMDGFGNAFDQCLLFASLLREAGYTAHIIQGAIRLEEADYQAWWNVSDIWAAQSYCGNEFIPIVTVPTWTGSTFYMDIKHVWVAWIDGGSTYYFDPSYKQYTRTSPLSSVTLAAALDYDSVTFMNDAESGATIDGGGDFVQKMNRGNIRDNLTTYTSNLIDYINNNTIGSAAPGTATVDDILGGQTIIPPQLPILQTSLPYEMPDDDPNVWTGDIPDSYIPTLEIQMVNQDDPGIIDFDFSISAPELAATRLTLWYESDIPSLYLNGDVVATGVAQDPFGWATWIILTVNHPAYDASEYPISWQQWYQTTWQWNQGPIIPGGPSYLIANAWGNASTGQMRFHQKQLAANQASGGSPTDENILGEKLAIAAWNWTAQNSKVCELENKLRVCHSMYHHQVGLLSFNLWGDGAIAIDLGGVSGSSTNFNNDVTQTPPNDRVIAMHGVALEAGVCAQMTGLVPGISTTTVVDQAGRTVRATIGGAATAGDILTITAHDLNLSGGQESASYTVSSGNTLSDIADGLAAALNANTSLSLTGITATVSGSQIAIYSQSSEETTFTSSTSGGATETISLAYDKIFKGTSANWNIGTNVESILIGNGYDSGQMSDLYNSWIQWGNIAVLADHPNQVLGAWLGWGDWVYPPAGAYGFILGGFKGGGGQPGDLNDGPSDGNPGDGTTGQDQTCDPIGWFTGDYSYDNSDISVGSGNFPFRLSFERSYSSASQYSSGALGRGWGHNWQMSVSLNSDGFLAMGMLSGVQAAATLAEFFVANDIASDTTFSVSKLVTMCLGDKWWLDQIIKNAVVVSTPDSTRIFIKQPDGTYSLPVGNSSTLTINAGLYKLTDSRGLEYSFNADGQLETIDYPSGTSLNLAYTFGKLQSISNGMGRVLTLTYTGDKITSVTDGNGRFVNYSYGVDHNLETFTDAESNVVTYVYDQPGRMVQYFMPANPTVPVVTNIYDSLSRIQSQANARNQTWTYYFAGSRSEEVDPLGDSHVKYMNAFGATIRDINALGFKTEHVYDGLNRRILSTMPEGNKISYEYDLANNVVLKTMIAKPGSILPDITNSWTYNSTFNTPATFTNGEGSTWSWNYDSQTGNLTSVILPTVNGKIPKRVYQHNSRGQIVSYIDETGLQTQQVYDQSNGNLISRIVNTNWRATVSGTITASDVLTLTAHDLLLPGGQKSVNYTVMGGDNLTLIAAGIANAVNADSDLAQVGVVATADGPILSLSTASGNLTTFATSSSIGATVNVSVNQGLNLTRIFGYNAWGDLSSVEDENSNEWTYTFSNERRMLQALSPAPFSYTTNYTYDENGNRLTMARQKDATPSWVTVSTSYTVTGQIYQVIDSNGYAYERSYDGKDRLATYTDAELRIWSFDYDQLDRIDAITNPALSVSEAKTFTQNGQLYELTDANNNTTTYSWDGHDRLSRIDFADATYEENEVYDANNNVITWRNRSGDEIANTFDALNRLTEKSPDGQPTVSYTYDLVGRMLGVSTPVVSGDPASGDYQFRFDTAGRFVNAVTPDGKQTSYELDSAGNITVFTYPDGYFVTRVYDELNRLTEIKLNGSSTASLSFEYDFLSRRNRLTYGNAAEANYNYQNNGDMISLEHIFNVSTSVQFDYTYNSVHELVDQNVDSAAFLWHPAVAASISYGTASDTNQYPTVAGTPLSYNANGCLASDGTWTFSYDTENHLIGASKLGVSANYNYDGLHRQIQKEVSASKTRFVYDEWQRVASYDNSGALQTRYIYGAGLDECLITVDNLGNLSFFHLDRMGTPIALSDVGGNITNQFALSPFGEGVPSGTDFGFTGQRYDLETGLYNFKRRYYSPALGRFLQPDPLLYKDGLNLYTYAGNSPLLYTDPYGLSCGCGCDNNAPPTTDETFGSPPPAQHSKSKHGFPDCKDIDCCESNADWCYILYGDPRCCDQKYFACTNVIDRGGTYWGYYWDECIKKFAPPCCSATCVTPGCTGG